MIELPIELPENKRPTLEEYNRELDEADKRIESGEYYTNEEVKRLLENV